MYAKIDRDYLDMTDLDIPSRVGVRFGSKDQAEGTVIRFRLLDDDREVYYGGEGDDDGIEKALMWAMRDAGATIAQVKDDFGKWQDYMN